MAKIETAFLAYRHTGEDPAVLEPMLSGVVQALGNAGIETYCTFFEEEHFKVKQYRPRQVMEHAFEMIEQRDALFIIQAKDDKSEGMLMEGGRFFAKKLVVVGTHTSVDRSKTYLPDMADKSFLYTTQQELENGFVTAIEEHGE